MLNSLECFYCIAAGAHNFYFGDMHGIFPYNLHSMRLIINYNRPDLHFLFFAVEDN